MIEKNESSLYGQQWGPAGVCLDKLMETEILLAYKEATMSEKKCVVLLSGGLDSTVLMYSLVNEYEVWPLTLSYGQKHSKEIVAARNVCEARDHNLLLRWKYVDLSILRALLPSALTGVGEIPQGHYEDESMKQTVVPNRNMILLAIAAGYANGIGAKYVAYGAHMGDHAIYPDCREEFVQACRYAIRLGTGWNNDGVELLAPFTGMTKATIVRLGRSLCVPFSKTWSCYEGKDVHCGACGTCFVEGSKVLMSNLTLRTIESVVVGDRVMAFDEWPESSMRFLRVAEVTRVVDNGVRDVWELRGEDGRSVQCTPEHEFLMNKFNSGHNLLWREIGRLYDKPKKFPIMPYFVNSVDNYDCGWVRGMMDSDGSLTIEHPGVYDYKRFALHQKDVTVLVDAKRLLDVWNVSSNLSTDGKGMSHLTTQVQEGVNNLLHRIDYTTDIDYARGYLAGFFIGDGSIGTRQTDSAIRIRYGQKQNSAFIPKLVEYLKLLDLKYSCYTRITGPQSYRPGTVVEEIDVSSAFVAKVPVLYGGQKRCDYEDATLQGVGCGIGSLPRILATRSFGVVDSRRVFDLTTTSGTYICEGFLVHNCTERREAFQVAGVIDPTVYIAEKLKEVK